MDTIVNWIKLVTASVSATLAFVFGGWDMWFAALCVFMAIDLATGLIKACLHKSEKSEDGGLSSKEMAKGGVKKVLIFALVAAGTMADRLVSPDSQVIRMMVIGYYIAEEALSVCENAIACGVPLPKRLRQVFENMRDAADKEE